MTGMVNFLFKFLLVNFAVHLVVFLWLALTRKKDYHFVLSLTFFFLTLSFALRLWLPEAEFHGHKIFWYFRMSALATTAAALFLIFRRKQKKTAEISSQN